MKNRAFKLLRTTIIILSVLFALFPFYVMVKNSFEPFSRITSSTFHFLPESFYIENYRTLILQYPILRWMLNSIIVCVFLIIGTVFFSVFAAYALTRLDFIGKKVVFVIIMGSMIIPEQVVIVPLYNLTNSLGWINTYSALIFPSMISAFGVLLLRQYFASIPYELDEAAIIDGCNRVDVLWRIIIPNAKPAIATLVVIKFMWTWGKFLWPSLAINSENMRTLPVGISYFKTSAATDPWDMTITGSMFLVIPIVLLFISMQKYFVKGLTDGAIKG